MGEQSVFRRLQNIRKAALGTAPVREVDKGG
jgi:hypothetical protein